MTTVGATPRRLVLCCDGTWNKPDEIRRGFVSPTNVAKLALGLAETDDHGAEQILYYQEGVGTRRLEHVLGGAFGYGLSSNVRDCYRFLVENYQPGDAIYLFGFSRGAYTARSTAGMIRNCGILRREHAGLVNQAFKLYRDRTNRKRPDGYEARIFRRAFSHDDVPIHFIGVWDTVGALGIPVHIPLWQGLWGFHDTQLSSYVRNAHQALAIDEQRRAFKPTPWTRPREVPGQTLEQVWFRGVHTDVGGGYHDPELSEITLLWMVERASACGLAAIPGYFDRTGPPIAEALRETGAEIAPDALGVVHTSRKGIYKLAPPYHRPLPRVPADADDCSVQTVASSAARRAKERPEDVPGELERYLSAGGPLTPVVDTPT